MKINFIPGLLVFLFFAVESFAAGAAAAAKIDIPLITNEKTQQKELAVAKLNDIIRNIKQQKKEAETKFRLLAKAKTEKEKNKIQTNLNELNDSIAEQESSFEMILTAGLELSREETIDKREFDWKKDLLEIVQPIMSELRKFTEEKRKTDNLQKKIDFYKSQIRIIEEVLKHIAGINKAGLEKETLAEFERIASKWQDQLEENQHFLEVVQLQFDEMIKSQSIKEVSLVEHIQQFAAGRGATLLMALSAFVAVYFSMLLLLKFLRWLANRKGEERSTYYQRIVTLCYHFLMTVLSITAAFYVLSVRNDQVLTGITLLLLISIVWVLKNSFPSYINELRILLNTGSVREGECIIYNGIKMKVESLNYYSKLTNPVLPGLELRLTLAELAKFVSRPYAVNEPWFPCQVGDYVMLSDNTFAMVNYITLENVLLSQANGWMPITYSISDFLAAKPKNLSLGFTVVSDFRIDYKHQAQCITVIPEVLCDGIRRGLLLEPYGQSLIDVAVKFVQANTSSLDYKLIASFDGTVAGEFFAIQFEMQRYAVEVCNQQQWVIPFNQLVVHNAKD